MRQLLLRLWMLPWPERLRQQMEGIIFSAPFRRLMIPHFAVGVVGIIRNDRGEFLVLRHTYRQKHPWGLPTGFMEHGEQPADALKREIGEETGYQVALSPVWSVYTDVDRPVVNIVFRGLARGGEFKPSAEISAARWVAAAELPAILPDQQRLIEAWESEENHEDVARIRP